MLHVAPNRFVFLLLLSFLIGPLWAKDEGVLEQTAEVTDPTEARPLVHAHAHNDYNHERPLFDALSAFLLSQMGATRDARITVNSVSTW